MTTQKIDEIEGEPKILELAGCQVISAEQNDLRGYEVETYSSAVKGIVKVWDKISHRENRWFSIYCI